MRRVAVEAARPVSRAGLEPSSIPCGTGGDPGAELRLWYSPSWRTSLSRVVRAAAVGFTCAFTEGARGGGARHRGRAGGGRGFRMRRGEFVASLEGGDGAADERLNSCHRLFPEHSPGWWVHNSRQGCRCSALALARSFPVSAGIPSKAHPEFGAPLPGISLRIQWNGVGSDTVSGVRKSSDRVSRPSTCWNSASNGGRVHRFKSRRNLLSIRGPGRDTGSMWFAASSRAVIPAGRRR